MAAIIRVKRGTASAWTSANPTLTAGEMGYETDTNKVKVGNGSTAWNSLGYLSGVAETPYVWSGYLAGGATWSRSNSVFGEPVVSGTPTLTETHDVNFGGTPAIYGTDKCGVTLDYPVAGQYLIECITSLRLTTTINVNSICRVELSTSTGTVLATTPVNMLNFNLATATFGGGVFLKGILNVASPSTISLRLQVNSSNSGAVVVSPDTTAARAVQFNVRKIPGT